MLRFHALNEFDWITNSCRYGCNRAYFSIETNVYEKIKLIQQELGIKFLKSNNSDSTL